MLSIGLVGTLSQVDVFKNYPTKYTDTNIAVNTYTTISTGVSQSTDLPRAFANFKRFSKTMTVLNVPINQCSLRAAPLRIIEVKANKGCFCLNPKHKNTWVNFVCLTPQLYTRAYMASGLQYRFHINGFIEQVHNQVPVMDVMLRKCHKHPTFVDLKAAMNSFRFLFHPHVENGHFNDYIYE